MTEMMGYITANAWDEVTAQLVRAIDQLAAAGADFAVIASNTPHIVFDAIRARSRLPLISIVEATCRYTAEIGCRRAAVLGTLFTMQSGLYTKAFERYGIEAFAPDEETQKEVYGLFFPNLENGIVIPEDRERLIVIAKEFVNSSRADALVLGCTELPLAIKPGDIDTMLLDTVQIHIEAIIREILS
jgi:aspartate racemase